ncbi:hypothetical protein UlMin_010456 [Ulmus minor]
MAKPRFLLLTYPVQGHINPAMQFAKRLIQIGAEVTYLTANSAYRRMTTNCSTNFPNELSFAPFSDGYDEGFKHGDNVNHYASELARRGSLALSELIDSGLNEGRPFTCLVYSMLLPWAALVAEKFHLPSVMLAVQPATVLSSYYYYIYGYEDTIKEKFRVEDDSSSIGFPGLPFLTIRDLPSILNPSNSHASHLGLFKEQFEILEKGNKPRVLVNTFDELEREALRAIGQLNLIGIGPLIPSAFLGEKDSFDSSFRADLLPSSNNYIEWLNLKPKGSVVYVSFGSFSGLSKPQTEELAKGLLGFGRPFLWVIREKENVAEDEKLSCREELEKLGMIVPWCSQADILSNSSLACFVTHCGWNSSLESLASGVPLVVFPQRSDQFTNAKMIADVWKTGVRVKANKDGVPEGEEVKRCLELVTGEGEEGREIRRNAEKWKILSREAAKGGSSDRNFKSFVDEIVNG